MQKPKANRPNAYFYSAKTGIDFVHSGCALLDCVLGGGWALGRVANIIGDFSTGKSLLAIEACANFARQYPKGKIYYREIESAWDNEYAQAVGLPLNRVDFGKEKMDTVEELFRDMESVIKSNRSHGLYIVDSLDALTDESEKGRAIEEKDYPRKPALMSQLFRRLVRQLNNSNIGVIIISQVRDNIGVSFGRKYTRTGGKALDFYASQVVWLAQMKKLKRTINKVERLTGVQIKAQCSKNKVGLPFRECQFNILFGYGVDDVTSNLEWLDSVGKLNTLGLTKAQIPTTASDVMRMSAATRLGMREELNQAVTEAWFEIERKFLPTSNKYT